MSPNNAVAAVYGNVTRWRFTSRVGFFFGGISNGGISKKSNENDVNEGYDFFRIKIKVAQRSWKFTIMSSVIYCKLFKLEKELKCNFLKMLLVCFYFVFFPSS